MITNCLTWLCDASGQKVNTLKSKVYFSPYIQECEAAAICTTLAIERTDDLGKYFGVPTINGRVTNATYKQVLERVKRRLAG